MRASVKSVHGVRRLWRRQSFRKTCPPTGAAARIMGRLSAGWPWFFPVRALHDRGVPVAFASDWPASDVDPMRSIKAAVTRKPRKDGHPGHESTLFEALHGYAAGGAYAGHDDHRLGSLTVGKQADIVVVDCDIEAPDTDALDQTRAAVTICAGDIIWQA